MALGVNRRSRNIFSSFRHVLLDKWILVLAFIFLSSAVLTTEGAKKRKKCGDAIQLRPNSEDSEFDIPPHPAPPHGSPCTWEIFGGAKCEVALSCDINLRKTEDCSEEYLLVTDGAGGQRRFCGQTKFEGLRASSGLRDLYLKLESAEEKSGSPGDISCTASCGAKGGSGSRLQKNLEKKRAGCVCGLRNDEDRIVGGEDAKFNEFPWQAAIVKPGTRVPFCGGTVINNRYILTATHCFWFSKKKAADIEVLLHAHVLDMHKLKGGKDVALGEKDSIRGPGWDAAKRTDEQEKTLRFAVEEVIMHPLFTKLYDYDFALLRIKGKLNLEEADTPTPICLPPANTFESLSLNEQNLTVSGWGLADEYAKASTRILQKLDVPFIPSPRCVLFYRKLITDRMICAGYEQGLKDACTGDSGGPLIFKVPSKQWWQMGIVSFGEGCARSGKPGIYAKVVEMGQWIDYHTMQDDVKWCRDSS